MTDKLGEDLLSTVNLFFEERDIFLFKLNYHFKMKKLLAFVVLAGFLTGCSQYTCPTYTKKEAPKKTDSTTQRI
jgi:hypothetical protein